MIPSGHLATLLQEFIAEEIKAETYRLALGSATDWEDYKQRTGQIAGMKKVDEKITALMEDKT